MSLKDRFYVLPEIAEGGSKELRSGEYLLRSGLYLQERKLRLCARKYPMEY